MNTITIKITDLERIMREWGAIPGDWRHFFTHLKEASIENTPPVTPPQNQQPMTNQEAINILMLHTAWLTDRDGCAIDIAIEAIKQRPEKPSDQ